jgi:hypothetical protein
MPRVYDKANGELLGHISQDDLGLMCRLLEEQSGQAREYCMDNDAFLRLTEAGASSTLLDALKSALDLSGKCNVRWEAD